MASFKLFDMTAKENGKIELSDEVFKAEYNPSLIHEVIVAQAANARQGTKSTLSRSEIVGGKAKPFRQKGTGRARQGSSNAPHQIGGGVAFAPKPRDFSKKVNKEAKRVALRSAISEKARLNELTFLKELVTKEAKTKEMAAVIKNFKFDSKTVLFVLDSNDEMLRRAIRNIPTAKSSLANTVSVTDVVKYNYVFVTEKAAKMIEEALS